MVTHCVRLQIWVASGHNASGYFSIYGEEPSAHQSHFEARLETGDTRTTYARTGYLGFVRRTNLTQQDGGRHTPLAGLQSLAASSQHKKQFRCYVPFSHQGHKLRILCEICNCVVMFCQSVMTPSSWWAHLRRRSCCSDKT